MNNHQTSEEYDNMIIILWYKSNCDISRAPLTCLKGILGNLLAECIWVVVDLISLETYC